MTATLVHPDGWYPGAWRSRPALQLPVYPDAAALRAVEERLAHAPPVVAIDAAAELRRAMAGLATGSGFLLQGGDCAESFDDPVAEQVSGLAGLFDAMARRLAGAGPLIEIARIAGQFAKPRSDETEAQDGAVLPAYRGDIVNSASFDAASRRADPGRMIRAHMQSVGTAASLAAAREPDRPIFTSHEALLLPYEQALARRDPGGRWWACSGHMLWLGERTRQPEGAHACFLSGIENVVGVKCGPGMSGDDLVRLVTTLDPANRPGKLVMIGRFGADAIEAVLPPLFACARREGLRLVWAIDPMHGNTTMAGRRKVRRLSDIVSEIDSFFAIARDSGVHPAGVHLEMSARDVTECLGGRGPASIGELERNWLTSCDPRLNANQAVDVAAHIAGLVA